MTTPTQPRRCRRRGKMFSQQGIALLVVTTSLLIVGFMAKEFATNTTIDSFGAANSRDQMRANRRPVLEAMPGAAAGDPDVVERRVAIDHEVARDEFVLLRQRKGHP